MTEEDTRSLPGAAQAALRNRAVRAVLDGMTQAEAARVVRVHHNGVNRWVKRSREGGFQGLAEQRRGRRPGEQAALTQWQQQELIALVRESTPDQLGQGGVSLDPRCGRRANRPALGRWLARTTVGGYLRGWGFSPQRPQHHALEQNPAAVRRWLAETYPAICAQARREGGVVLWLDEMGWVRMRRRAAPGRRLARPRSSSGPARGSGST